ncbi:unnamed protein product [Cladocopium goreaui]|uniref:Tyr recombinase domain-containing protein n=1 Tax=Cladocopium goreaui TaxID=2562237 RepID=A0A9P1GIG9_9DINO|nr:unnamed protein product [Cladocopium goreaui]
MLAANSVSQLSALAAAWRKQGIIGIIGAFFVVNVATVALFWYDKHQAKHGGWRVPEKTLQGTAALGGWPAGYVAMQMFHHKTKRLGSFISDLRKESFRASDLGQVGEMEMEADIILVSVGYHAATAANVGLCSVGMASLVGKAGAVVAPKRRPKRGERGNQRRS